jgi:hypothetical protein
MAVTYLTTDHLVALHERALEEGGLAGVRSLHALGSAVAQVEGHPFNDANKRTAALAMEVFLDLNGYELQQTDEEIETMIVALAANTVDQGEFFAWVVHHIRPSAPASNVIPLPPLTPRRNLMDLASVAPVWYSVLDF